MNHVAFFDDVARRIGCDISRADALTPAVFQELRDRLSPRETGQAAAQMDAELRSLRLTLNHPQRRIRRVHAYEFIGDVRRIVGLVDNLEAKRATRAVFAAL